MGKKRIIKKSGEITDGAAKTSAAKGTKQRLEHGRLYVNASYNNTMLLLTDQEGKAIVWSSSGALGFKGSKKGTPFAASKVGELLAEKGQAMGLKEIDIFIRGVGAGRESSIRSFIVKGVTINSIKDETPTPFNGPKLKKARRV